MWTNERNNVNTLEEKLSQTDNVVFVATGFSALNCFHVCLRRTFLPLVTLGWDKFYTQTFFFWLAQKKPPRKTMQRDTWRCWHFTLTCARRTHQKNSHLCEKVPQMASWDKSSLRSLWVERGGPIHQHHNKWRRRTTKAVECGSTSHGEIRFCPNNPYSGLVHKEIVENFYVIHVRQWKSHEPEAGFTV